MYKKYQLEKAAVGVGTLMSAGIKTGLKGIRAGVGAFKNTMGGNTSLAAQAGATMKKNLNQSGAFLNKGIKQITGGGVVNKALTGTAATAAVTGASNKPLKTPKPTQTAGVAGQPTGGIKTAGLFDVFKRKQRDANGLVEPVGMGSGFTPKTKVDPRIGTGPQYVKRDALAKPLENATLRTSSGRVDRNFKKNLQVKNNRDMKRRGIVNSRGVVTNNPRPQQFIDPNVATAPMEGGFVKKPNIVDRFKNRFGKNKGQLVKYDQTTKIDNVPHDMANRPVDNQKSYSNTADAVAHQSKVKTKRSFLKGKGMLLGTGAALFSQFLPNKNDEDAGSTGTATTLRNDARQQIQSY